MKLKSILLTAVTTLSVATATMAQTPTQQWITTLNTGNSSIDGFDVCSFADYWFFSKRIAMSKDATKIGITGISGCDVYTGIVSTSNGSILLNNAYTSTGNDGGQSIAGDINNNFISTGILYPSGNNSRGLFTKVNSGNTLDFQNIINPTGSNTQTEIGSLRIDSSGNIYLQGMEYTGSSNLNTLRKYSATGTLLWTSTISDYDWFYGYPGKLTLDPSGNAIFTGKRQSTNKDPSTYDIVIRKVNTSGTQLWQTYYNVGEDYINNITTDSQGDIYFTMEDRNLENKVVKLDGTTGNVIWSTQFNSGTSKNANIKINANGNVIVGYTQTKAFDSSTGALLWTFNTNGYSLDTDNNSKIYSVANNKIYIVNGNGTFSDSISFSIPNFTVTLRDIVVSGNSFYITGKSVSGSYSKIFIAKYNALNCAKNTTITPQTNSLSKGITATFAASTSDPNPSFVWQSDYGQGFQTLNNFGNYSGANSATLSIANVQLPNHTQPIRVITTSGNCVDTSNVAVINILDTCLLTVYDTLLTTVTDTLVINAQITGINSPNNLNTLKVFPNPASTHITIDYGNFNAMSGYTLKIVNAVGQTVFTTPINQQTSFIDLSTWTGNGIYFVQLIDPQNNTIENRKIVIQ